MSFTRYESYKDSGVEWLGEVPEHWEVCALRRLLSVPLANGIFKKKDDFGDGVLLVNVFDVYQNDFKIKYEQLDRVKCSHDEAITYQVLPDDLFFVRSSLKQEGIAVVVIAGISEEDVVFECHLIRARPKQSNVNSRYCSYLLNSLIYRAKMIAKAKITTMTTIDQEAILSTILPLPPKDEQQTIAVFLDRETAKIDALIAEQQRLIELLKENRQAVISHAVTKGLNPNAPMKDSGIEWLGEVPKHWFVVPIKRLCEVKDGTHDTPHYVDKSESSYPLITSKDFDGNSICFDNAKYISLEDHLEIIKRSNTEVEDVLMSMIGGNIGKALIVTDDNNFSIKNVALFKTKGNCNLAKYILFYLQSGLLDIQISLLSRGGAQGFLSLGDLRNLIFFKFPLEELEGIVTFLSEQTLKIDKLVGEANFQIELLQERRTALISAAVTGKIDVRGLVSANPEVKSEVVPC
ncbi:MAG: restriction endonuclease subunit S [Methyloglobulus sp.]|nr:hypothetical protein [Methyloglobulus sp.]